MCIFCDYAYYDSQLYPPNERRQNSVEECMNCLSHIIGVVYCIFQMKEFYKHCIQKNYSKEKKTAVLFFCISSLVLYTNSVLYHLFNLVTPNQLLIRYIFQRMDHITIYVMIAGCYVSFIFSRLFDKGYYKTGITVTVLICLMGFTGFVFSAFFPPSQETNTLMYLIMGFSSVVLAPGWIYFCPISLLLLGGFNYALGTVFFSMDKMLFHHCIWHIIVMLANLQHSFAVIIAIDDDSPKTFWGTFMYPIHVVHSTIKSYFIKENIKTN